MKRASLLPSVLIAALLLAAALLFVLSRAHGFATNSAGQNTSSSTSSLPKPPVTCNYCPAHLLNASPAEIGELAVKYATGMGEVKGEPPRVMLARLIKPEDFQALSLGCPPSLMTIEQPPLALVILKGDLQRQMPGIMPFLPR